MALSANEKKELEVLRKDMEDIRDRLEELGEREQEDGDETLGNKLSSVSWDIELASDELKNILRYYGA